MRISDWSSDVCSSDLKGRLSYRWKSKYAGIGPADAARLKGLEEENRRLKNLLAESMLDNAALKDLDRKSVVEGKSVSVRVDLGGRRIIKKKTTRANTVYENYKDTNIHKIKLIY